MAQAAVDLPDPLEKPADSPVNTDQLLSELAGSEIDRLLAEADSDPAPAPAANPAAEDRADISNQLGDLLDKAQNGVPGELPKTQAPAVAASPAAEPADAEGAVRGSEREAMLEAAGFEAKAPAGEPAAPASQTTDADTSPTERQALLKAAGFEPPAADEAEPDEPPEPLEDEAAVPYVMPSPIYLKPLEWINAPLQALPQHARDLMGRIGIITSINAVAVIVYVLLFRKH